MANTVIVYGRPAPADPTHIDRIRHSMRCNAVIETWQPGDEITRGACHFTEADASDITIEAGQYWARLMPFEKAANWANIQ